MSIKRHPKEKTKETKNELKKKKLAVKRARQDRDNLHHELNEERQRNQGLFAQKDAEIAELRSQLKDANQQIEGLKKKSSCR